MKLVALYNHVFAGSIASWFCIGSSGKFGYGTIDDHVENVEPDRTDCIHQWIMDVEEQVIPFIYQYWSYVSYVIVIGQQIYFFA